MDLTGAPLGGDIGTILFVLGAALVVSIIIYLLGDNE